MERLYRVLSRPLVYKWATTLLAPGGEARITREIQKLISTLPEGEPLLEVGCGPRSWLDRIGLSPVGLDVDPAYVRAYQARGGVAVHGSAEEIPFPDRQFAGVWCIGVLHHLTT
jgi:ubiquinone/menaquinone biosynthesis C-methylase UbiE